MLDKKNKAAVLQGEIADGSTSREKDQKRSTDVRRTEQLETFSAAIRAPQKKVRFDRRRKRKTVADIDVPLKQNNMNALRFALRVSDIFWVTTIIALAVWNAYIGVNNNNIIAPIAAALLGMGVFISMLFITRAHRFAPAETLHQHMKTIFIAAFSALGLWLTIALITRPDTFLPDALAKAGLGATAILFVLHALYHTQIKRLHARRALAPTIVMLGATESARRIIEENAKTKELNILAIFDERLAHAPHNIHGVPVIGKIKDLLEWDQLPYINQIVVTLPKIAQARKKEFVDQIRLLPNRIAFVVDEFEDLNHVQQRLSQACRH